MNTSIAVVKGKPPAFKSQTLGPLLQVEAAVWCPKLVTGLSNQCSPSGRCQTQENGQQQRYACPVEFIHLGNRCYYFSSEMASWHSAHFSCRDRGSQLASLETRWEDNTIRSYLNRPEFGEMSYFLYFVYNEFNCLTLHYGLLVLIFTLCRGFSTSQQMGWWDLQLVTQAMEVGITRHCDDLQWLPNTTLSSLYSLAMCLPFPRTCIPLEPPILHQCYALPLWSCTDYSAR